MSAITRILARMESLGLLPAVRPRNLNHIIVCIGPTILLEYYKARR